MIHPLHPTGLAAITATIFCLTWIVIAIVADVQAIKSLFAYAKGIEVSNAGEHITVKLPNPMVNTVPAQPPAPSSFSRSMIQRPKIEQRWELHEPKGH